MLQLRHGSSPPSITARLLPISGIAHVMIRPSRHTTAVKYSRQALNERLSTFVVAQLLDQTLLLTLGPLQRVQLKGEALQLLSFLLNDRLHVLLLAPTRIGLHIRPVALSNGAKLLILDLVGLAVEHLDEYL